MFLRSFVPLPIVYSYHFTVWIESTPICLRGTVPEAGSICPKDLPFIAYAIFALAILLASTPLYYNAVGSLNTTPNNPSFQGELASSFFFQAEDGIRDLTVTGVQTCALPI